MLRPYITPGYVSVAASSKGTLAVGLPAYKVLVEKILIAVTSLDCLVNIYRSDLGESLTKGGILSLLLGAQVLTIALPDEYTGPPPFHAELNTTLTFDITNQSVAANKFYVGIVTQKVS